MESCNDIVGSSAVGGIFAVRMIHEPSETTPKPPQELADRLRAKTRKNSESVLAVLVPAVPFRKPRRAAALWRGDQEHSPPDPRKYTTGQSQPVSE